MIHVTMIQTARLRMRIVMKTNDHLIPTPAKKEHREMLEVREIPMFSMWIGRSLLRTTLTDIPSLSLE